MELTGKYRHELKYAITSADHLALRQRLRTVMKADPHVGADGCYIIRSVYFDNYRDKALREKLFIAPKVRQVLYGTSQRVFTRCACAQRTGFLIKFLIKNQYQNLKSSEKPVIANERRP